MSTDAPTEKVGTILLVEDDEFLRGLLAQKLESRGFTVAIGKDGESALASATAHAPDLILLDLFLPGMSGFELIAKLRQQPQTATIPFMVLSNSAESQSKQEGEALGAQMYLIKAQSTPAEIVETIEGWFKKR